MFGQILMTKPVYPKMQIPNASTNDNASRFVRIARKIPQMQATTRIGAGINQMKLPLPNQCCAMAGKPMTVHRLTTTVAANSTATKESISAGIFSCNSTSTLRICQPHPSIAYVTSTPIPQNELNGKGQSKLSPANRPSTTSIPCSKEPSTVP